MSLQIHVKKIQDEELLFYSKVDLALSFLKHFSKFKLESWYCELLVDGVSKKFPLPSNNLSMEAVERSIKDKKFNGKWKDLSLYFNCIISKNSAVIEVNNSFESKIYGDVVVDVYPNKLGKVDLQSFKSLFDNKIINPKNLDKFFEIMYSKSYKIQKAYVNASDSLEPDNPLGFIYVYHADKAEIFRPVIFCKSK